MIQHKNIFKFRLTLLLLTAFLFSQSIYAQKNFLFGLNAPFTDPVLQNIIAKQDLSMKDLLDNYHINYLRYPGGIPTRYYFWDRADLTGEAMKLYSEYLKGRGDKRQDYYSNYSENVKASENNYKEFLSYCKKNNVIPIIELNTSFYLNNNKIYQVEKFQKQKSKVLLQQNRWNNIKEYIIAQMEFTHNIVDEVIWEFGNEDYFMYDAEEYANLSINFMNIVKKRFPNDKIIVEMSNSWSKGARKKEWNKLFINYLNNKGVLEKIDYFAPHFYDNGGEQFDNTKEMMTKITNDNISKFVEVTLANFPAGFKPKFFFTEFAAVMTALDNKNYNTQMHALLYFNYYMRFFASPYIVGIVQHTFTTLKAGFFYSPTAKEKLDYIKEHNSPLDIIEYIPPQSEAIKIFFDSVGDKLFSFYPTDSFLLLITESKGKVIVQILNFDDKPHEVKFNNIQDLIGKKTGKVKTYTFDDLNAHYWYPEKTSISSDLNSTEISVPKHSFTTIIY